MFCRKPTEFHSEAENRGRRALVRARMKATLNRVAFVVTRLLPGYFLAFFSAFGFGSFFAFGCFGSGFSVIGSKP